MSSNLFVLLFFVTPRLVVAVQPCMERIPINKKEKQKTAFKIFNRSCKKLKICESCTRQWQQYGNVRLDWTIKNNNVFTEYKYIPWGLVTKKCHDYAEQIQRRTATWSVRWQSCIANLVKSHFGMEATAQTHRILLEHSP